MLQYVHQLVANFVCLYFGAWHLLFSDFIREQVARQNSVLQATKQVLAKRS